MRAPPHGVAREELVDRRGIDFARHARRREDRLELRSEDEPLRRVRVVEGLLSQPVARGEEAAARRVPDGEREHPVQARDAIRSPDRVRLEEDLAVGARREDVPGGLQLGADLQEVVDLPVEEERVGAPLALHGLVTAGEIDDGETPVGEPRLAEHGDPLVVRTPMAQERRHALEGGAFRRSGLQLDNSGDAAHQRRPPLDAGIRAGRIGWTLLMIPLPGPGP